MGRGTGPSIRDFSEQRFRLLTLRSRLADFRLVDRQRQPSTPGGVIPHPTRPLVTLPIIVGLTSVADLTDPVEAATVDTNAQELTGDWRSYATRIPPFVPPGPHSGLPPTQNLGIALHGLARHQGLITFSATLPDYKILVIFPDRLNKGSADYVQYSFHDDRGAMQVKRIP